MRFRLSKFVLVPLCVLSGVGLVACGPLPLPSPTPPSPTPPPTATLTPEEHAEVEELVSLFDGLFGTSCGGSWKCHWFDDPIHDRVFLARLPSAERLAFLEIAGPADDSLELPEQYLTVRCLGNVTDLMVEWGKPIGETDATVISRIDDGIPQSGVWPIATSSDVTFYSANQAAVLDLLSSLLFANTLAVRVLAEGGNPVTATFELEGIAEAVTPVRTHCGW